MHLELSTVRLDQLLECVAVAGVRPVDQVARHRSTLASRLALMVLGIDTGGAANWAWRNGGRETAQSAVESVSKEQDPRDRPPRRGSPGTRCRHVKEGERDGRPHDRNARGMARGTR